MDRPEPVYPAKRTSSPNGEFAIPQFYLPIRINNNVLWGILDTGANISILPREIADKIVPKRHEEIDSGVYSLAGLVGVPYRSYNLDFEILEYIPETIPELDLTPYSGNHRSVVKVRNVEFQVPQQTWPEMADKLDADPPLNINGSEMNKAILGLYGVLDQLTLSFIGDNSVSISAHGPQ